MPFPATSPLNTAAIPLDINNMYSANSKRTLDGVAKHAKRSTHWAFPAPRGRFHCLHPATSHIPLPFSFRTPFLFGSGFLLPWFEHCISGCLDGGAAGFWTARLSQRLDAGFCCSTPDCSGKRLRTAYAGRQRHTISWISAASPDSHDVRTRRGRRALT